jgi:hypothetical protein
MGLCWWWVFNSPVFVEQIWATWNLQAKNGEGFSWILISSAKHFYGTKLLWWYPVMKDTVLCQRHGTTGGIKQMETHNRSENGRGARFALSAHLTHAHELKRIETAGTQGEKMHRKRLIAVIIFLWRKLLIMQISPPPDPVMFPRLVADIPLYSLPSNTVCVRAALRATQTAALTLILLLLIVHSLHEQTNLIVSMHHVTDSMLSVQKI